MPALGAELNSDNMLYGMIQANTWDIIIQAVSLLASMASLVLAIVAIWLSFKFYNMSVHSSEKIEEANRAIGASVDRLEKIFQMQYSDTFSMVRDTYSDFRKRLLAESASGEKSENLVESKADEKVEELRTELSAELSKVVERVGQTDAVISSLKKQLGEVVDKAIVRSREVEKEAHEETLRDSILAYLRNEPAKNRTAITIHGNFLGRFSGVDILQTLVDLTKEGKIKANKYVSSITSLQPDTKFSISE